MDKLLCPSLMCADYGSLADSVKTLDEAGIDIFHCDIMDGSFVPNITMGTLDVKAVRKHTKKPIDVHLMIENPLNKIDWFIEAGADIIYIHPESERYTVKALDYIKNKGKIPALAINPDTSVATVYEMLGLIDYLLVMTVSPGFAGQKYMEFTTVKIKKLIELKKQFGYKIVVDGGISREKIQELSGLGVEGFVLGSSVLFGQNRAYWEIVEEIRGL